MTHCDILLIDDDVEDIELLAYALNKSGFEKIHHAHTSKAAFEYLENVPAECIPKVIVTDFFLHLDTAIEFLTQLKNVEKYRNINVIVLSSSKSSLQTARLKEFGVFDYLVKPICFSEYENIAETVRTMVQE